MEETSDDVILEDKEDELTTSDEVDCIVDPTMDVDALLDVVEEVVDLEGDIVEEVETAGVDVETEELVPVCVLV